MSAVHWKINILWYCCTAIVSWLYVNIFIPMHIGPNGEPKVTHGNTLVSELSFEEVVQTINVRKNI